MKNKYTLLKYTALSLSAISAASIVHASSDYGPAIWDPPSCTKWYTSGNGHHFCVIHDMDGYYLGSISWLRNCSSTVSVHYCINGKQDTSTDHPPGEITQIVSESNYAWHVACWNPWMWGTEHEGFATNPAWYTDAMYEASGPLQRHLISQTVHPWDRNHIIGHNQWQNSAWKSWMAANYPSVNTSCNTHTDPGQYWAWDHLMSLTLHVLQGAIQAHYNALGGINSGLGDPTISETTTPDGIGRFNHFTKSASIYWTPNYGAWSIHGAIRDHWSSLGWETSPLGYPVSDETGTPDGIGRFNHFQVINGSAGSIYWTPNFGAWSIHGAIRDHWASMGWETSPLGYPVSDETGTPDGVGRFNHFQVINGSAGSIYFTPNYGAWSIHGSIRDKWSSMGWETSVLGYPVTDETGTPDGVGRFNHFQTLSQSSPDGSIYFTPSTGAHEVHGPIRTQWANMGWERSSLGYPTSDQFALNDGTGRVRNNFQNGTITYNPSTGQVTVP